MPWSPGLIVAAISSVISIGAHRKSAGNRLGEREHIRLDTIMLIGEQRPGPTETTLDLVENESDVSFGGQRADFANETSIENANAAFTLDRLENQCGHGLGIQRDGEIVDVALDDANSGRQRPERNAIRRPVCGGEASRTDVRETRRVAR